MRKTVGGEIRKTSWRWTVKTLVATRSLDCIGSVSLELTLHLWWAVDEGRVGATRTPIDLASVLQTSCKHWAVETCLL